ncbi:MAG: HDOD domain-containing protein, partial [Gammaproteobacteria bacterium]
MSAGSHGSVPVSQVGPTAAAKRVMRDLVSAPPDNPAEEMDNCEVVHGLLERCLAGEQLAVPMLPEVAVRVVRTGPKNSTNAHQLAEIINADPALSLYVLRVAASAAKRPVSPIVSLPHAVA